MTFSAFYRLIHPKSLQAIPRDDLHRLFVPYASFFDQCGASIPPPPQIPPAPNEPFGCQVIFQVLASSGPSAPAELMETLEMISDVVTSEDAQRLLDFARSDAFRVNELIGLQPHVTAVKLWVRDPVIFKQAIQRLRRFKLGFPDAPCGNGAGDGAVCTQCGVLTTQQANEPKDTKSKMARRIDLPAIQATPAPTEDVSEKTVVSEFYFRRRGRVWNLGFRGKSGDIPNRDARGLAYIQHLLARPGQKISVEDLEEMVTANVAVRAAAHGQEVADPDAMKAYFDELVELREELDDAITGDNDEMQRRLTKQIEELSSQVRKMLGLNGRVRRVGDEGEQMRSRVSKAITRARDEIKEDLPELSAHLHAIRCGRVVVYEPDELFSWEFS
ncbi:MAG: hypothetical protein U0640_02160 [Phycisphaerales bacterium]